MSELLYANSFTPKEVEAMLTLYRQSLWGSDCSQVARSPEMVSVARKFARMRKRYKADAEQKESAT